MKNRNSKSHQKWSIEDGDYRRSHEDTFTYQKQLRRKKLIKNSGYVIIFIIAIIASFFIFASKFI